MGAFHRFYGHKNLDYGQKIYKTCVNMIYSFTHVVNRVKMALVSCVWLLEGTAQIRGLGKS